MSISATQVKELRDKTGAGMMDCKKALAEANGDFEKAVEILRKKGASIAAKRADRSASEGIVLARVSDDKKSAVMVEVNCETDFVAKSDDFVKFAQLVLDTVEKSQVTTVEELINTSVEVKNGIEETMGKVGEKTEISRFTRVSSEDGIIVDYIHPGSRLGVLIQLSQVPAEHAAAFYTCGRDLAMQVAAMNPVSVSRDEVPQATIDSELEIYKELARKEGKPENMLEKISQGRLNKYFQENCLLEQVYTKDNSLTVKEYVAQVNKASGTNATVVKFTRFQLGDSSK